MAQPKPLQTWLDELAYLESASVALEEERSAVARILAGVQLWLKLRPDSGISIAPVPAPPWNEEQVRNLIAELRKAINSLLGQDPGHPFELGAMEISVTAEASLLSPVTAGLGYTEIRNLYATNLAQSITYLPGVVVDHNSASGRPGIRIRGFDTRQVGLYRDGMPVYVPFDGFANVARFLTSNLAGIEVAKGYSSPLLGPSGLGGVVNLVTRRPLEKLDADVGVGTGSGAKLESWLHLGTRWSDFFLRGGLDWVQSDYFPVSGKFILNSLQPGYHRTNSDQRDAGYSLRAGWTPRRQDQYVFSYSNQKADYGVPPYSGIDLNNNKPRYWRWPYWNIESYYFNSSTDLAGASGVKVRAFFDRYRNNMTGFTDVTYRTLASANPYDDHSQGTSVELTTRRFERHALGASFFWKDDIHKESSISYSGATQLVQPWRTHHDRLMSLGFQDIFNISSRLRATVGISADLLDAIMAQDLKTIVIGSGKSAITTYSVVPFTCPGSESGTSFSACLTRAWDYSPLASLSYSIGERDSLFLSFGRKSHFPTLKDRYSYRYGRAIPNPTLRPEYARNWMLGYTHVFGRSTVMQAELFRSDVYDAIQSAIIPAEYENQCPAMGAGMCQKVLNVSNEMHKGIELAVRTSPLARLSLDLNYSFLQWSIDGPANMLVAHPIRTPKHKAVGIAWFNLPAGISLTTSVRYESGAVTTNDAGIIVPASKFAVIDLAAKVPLKAGAAIQTGIKNLLDRNYYYQEGFPEPGRNWYLGLRYRF